MTKRRQRLLSSLGSTQRTTVSSFSGTLLHSSLFTPHLDYFILRSRTCYSHTSETHAVGFCINSHAVSDAFRLCALSAMERVLW